MSNIIRIRNLTGETFLNNVIIPVDKDSYTSNCKYITILDLKEFVLSGYTGTETYSHSGQPNYSVGGLLREDFLSGFTNVPVSQMFDWMLYPTTTTTTTLPPTTTTTTLPPTTTTTTLPPTTTTTSLAPTTTTTSLAPTTTTTTTLPPTTTTTTSAVSTCYNITLYYDAFAPICVGFDPGVSIDVDPGSLAVNWPSASFIWSSTPCYTGGSNYAPTGYYGSSESSVWRYWNGVLGTFGTSGTCP